MTEEFGNPEFVKDSQIGSRYESLFERHGQQANDIRRQSYLESMVRLSSRRMKRVLERIRIRLETGDEWMLQTFQEWITSFEALHEMQILQMPEGFLNPVWDVYKETMKHPEYYFSTNERLLFARLASVNVVITRYQQDTYHVVGSTLTSSDKLAVVYVCLGGDNSGRVRGHFERIWKRSDFEEARIAWILECEMRAEERPR